MDTMSREQAIKLIRAKLMEMVDDDHSMCRVATEKGIYCRGFRPLADDEMKRRYEWLLHRNPNMGRAELEDLANRWQIARQIVDRVPISCDAQTIERDTCDGWDTFDNGTLARFFHELTGGEILVQN
jgi:hypothetical protein